MTKQFLAKFPGVCHSCGNPINVGDPITWTRTRNAEGKKQRWHQGCPNPTGDTPTPKQPVDVPVTPAIPVTPVTAHPATTTAHPATQDGDIMKRLADAIGPFIQLNGDALKTEILALVEDRLASVITVREVLEIRLPDGTTIETDEPKHHLLPKLIKHILAPVVPGRNKKNYYLYGMPGSGKSYAGIQAARILNMDRDYLPCTPSTTKSDVFGFMSGMTGEYVTSGFRRIYECGGVFVFDELDNTDPRLQAGINGALENGDCAFPDALVKRHPSAVIIGTGNTAGYGANRQFPGRQPMDGAFRGRFAFISWETDEKMERQAALALNPRADKWIDWVQALRKLALKDYPQLLVTARASIDGAEKLAQGETCAEAAQMHLWQGYDADSVKAMLARLPYPSNSDAGMVA